MALLQRKLVKSLLMSENGLALLKQREGLRTTAYEDIGGVRTIGYGHTYGVRAGEVITAAQADTLLCTDLATFQAALDRAVVVPLAQYEYDALMSFIYNVGAEAFGRSTLLRKLNLQEYDQVPAELRNWCHVAGKFSQALFTRRKAEATQFAGTGQT